MKSSPMATTSYAEEVARLLWPEPWEVPYVTRDRHQAGRPHRDAYLFPSERRPRLLVPADLPASATMLRRLGNGGSVLSGSLRGVLEMSFRSRAFSYARWPMLRVPGNGSAGESIETYLATCFGRDVRIGILLGTRRVNQKPVLQIFDLQGSLLGYAKIGHNDLTAALVRQEARSLAAIQAREPVSFQVPDVLHEGQWEGLQVLVISALTPAQGNVPRAARVKAMTEVARIAGTTTMSVADSDFWARLRLRSEELPDHPFGSRLLAVGDRLLRAHGREPLEFGGWHGDWTRWNMGCSGERVLLWDWERYETEVPLGLDAIHLAAQGVRPGQGAERRQSAAFVATVPRELERLDVDPRRHQLTLRLYLLAIAVRYVDALTHGATPALQQRTSWVLSLLEQLPEHRATTLGRPMRGTP